MFVEEYSVLNGFACNLFFVKMLICTVILKCLILQKRKKLNY